MNKRIKIGVIEPAGQLYGSEFCLLDILEGLDPDRFEAEVLLPSEGPFKDRLAEAGMAHREMLPADPIGGGRFERMRAYYKIYRHWKANPPDLLYVNQAGILRPISWIARRLKKPVVCQVQTVEDAEWISGYPDAHEQVTHFICNSRFTASRLEAQPPPSIIYYGYRPKQLLRPRRESDGVFRLGLLGRIGGTKGHHMLVRAIAQLPEVQRRGIQVSFIGAATDPAEEHSLRQLMQELGIAELFEFRGYREEIAEELARLDVMLIPSKAEPFGRILCEAAEAQIPSIVADSGGLGELSLRYNLGLRFPAGDAPALAECMGTMRNDYEAQRIDFTEGAERLLNSLDFPAYIRIIEGMLDDAVHGRQSQIDWMGQDTP